MTKNVILIGIAGASASGKSLLANTIVNELGSDRAVVIPEDAYYKDHKNIPFEARANINYDHPDSIEHELMYQHLLQLQAGNTIEIPMYDFSQHLRCNTVRKIGYHSLVVLEGILLFVDPHLRELIAALLCLEQDYDDVIARLRAMAVAPKETSGFGGSGSVGFLK